MDDKDRFAVILAAVQTFGNSLTLEQFVSVRKQVFEGLGINLPDPENLPEETALD